jgi:predicted Zn finger-like uncharacterized protein
MNVRCPSCRTVFRVDPQKVPESGIRARCTVCAATMDVRRDGSPAHAPAAARPEPPRPTAAPPVAPPAQHRPAAPTVETAAVPSPPARPVATPPARLSQPFYQPRAPQPPVAPPPTAPTRPSAPVFRATPGQPVTAAPVPPPRAPLAPPPRAVTSATPGGPGAAAEVRKRPVNPFLQQDPQQKARRLARALVSDMIVYQPEKRQRALSAGNLKEAFEEEIQKSWEEYVEQVGEEMAESTPYWRDALNEILAGGQSIF